MADLNSQLQQLQNSYKQGHGNVQDAANAFTKFQVALIRKYTSLKSESEFITAMIGLEIGGLLYIDSRQALKFERVIQQLKQFYSFKKMCNKSENRQFLIGLYLMYLLTKNRLDDFHTELELLNDNDLSNQFIKFPMLIEEHLMDGAYNKILSIKSESFKDQRFDKFQLFLNDLENTVRNEIADSLESVHERMPVQDALRMLKLSNIRTLENWITQQNNEAGLEQKELENDMELDGIGNNELNEDNKKRNWNIEKGQTLVFVRREQEKQEIDAMETAKDMLEFTGQIETIV